MFGHKLTRTLKLMAVVSLLALLIVACGAQPTAQPTAQPAAESGESDTPSEPQVEPEQEAPATGAANAGFIFPGVVNDGSFNTLGFNAMQGAKEDLGFESTYAESVAPTDAPRVMGELVNGGANIVWAHSGTFVDPVVKTAADYPNASFVVYTGAEIPDAPENIWQIANVMGFRQVYCLAGVLAAEMTSSNVIGFVGGIELPVYAQGRQMYERCAQNVNPDIKVLGSFTGDFDDAVKAKEATTAQMEQGADVFAHSVNLGTYGMLEAIKSAPDVYIIGAEKREPDLDPERYLSAVLIDYEQVMKQIIPLAEQGELGGFYEATLDKGSAIIAPFTDVVPEAVRNTVMEAQDQIIAGEINLDLDE